MHQKQQQELERIDIGVVVPCYNSNLEWLVECLASIMQSLDAYDGEAEVVVVDDGSDFCIEDGVRRLLPNSVASDIRFYRKPNGGLSSARNFGMKQTRGVWCHFIDDDDLVEEGFYRELTKSAKEVQANLIFAESRFFGEVEGQFQFYNEHIVSRLAFGNVVHVNAVLARRSLFEQSGEFDEQLNGLEDWDMWLRCVRSGAEVALVHRSMAAVRIHRKSMSTNRRRMNSRMVELSTREWQDHFDFWISKSSQPSGVTRDWALAGLAYALRSESPLMNTLQFRRVIAERIGAAKSLRWLLRQTIKHILKPEKSQHSFR